VPQISEETHTLPGGSDRSENLPVRHRRCGRFQICVIRKPFHFLLFSRGRKAYLKFMPLVNCPDCGKPVSNSAHACPNCGYPIAEKLSAAQPQDATAQAGPSGQLLAEIRPSWWGYFWHLFFFWLIIPPIVAWFGRASTVLRIYPNRINLERGLLSKCYQDFNPKDIRSIDVDQGLFDRLVGIGDLTISTAATVEAAEELKSIPDPKGVRDLILAQRGSS
jgi:hypothetical protein